MLAKISLVLLLGITVLTTDHYGLSCSQAPQPDEAVTTKHFITLLTDDVEGRNKAIKYLDATWQNGYIVPLLDVIYLTSDQWSYRFLFDLIEKKTGLSLDRDVNVWLDWIWNKEQSILPFHANLMAAIYRNIDLRFEKYFKDRRKQAKIRLDEIRWGGVRQDGIPPLRTPKMINADEADYLDGDNVVFGIEINGDARAYPKRILAWHEMFVDEVGGKNIAGVYCTLCGTVIIYETTHNGVNHELGTSGFLYRSNKLMYDKATQSLWNTIEGRPVLGPLVNKGIELESYGLVTTTWKEWKAQHPGTRVLSLDTGHNRDYSEGAAYASYFATDDLMFTVPKRDKRLKNKDEVFVVRAQGYKQDPLAIASKYLKKKRVHRDVMGSTTISIFTDRSGASRAYDTGDTVFEKWDRSGKITDTRGVIWDISEDHLAAGDGKILKRLPAHRIFWFAWFNAYPETRLVK